MSIHNPSRIGISVSILRDDILSAIEFDLSFAEAVVMRECGAGCTLAVEAIAMDCKLIDSCHCEFDFATVTAHGA